MSMMTHYTAEERMRMSLDALSQQNTLGRLDNRVLQRRNSRKKLPDHQHGGAQRSYPRVCEGRRMDVSPWLLDLLVHKSYQENP